MCKINLVNCTPARNNHLKFLVNGQSISLNSIKLNIMILNLTSNLMWELVQNKPENIEKSTKSLLIFAETHSYINSY